jgi:ubiquinone/menaquinone biosynthesis C-methylase UbiE
METHDKIAEKYDEDNKAREFSNKFPRYRRALLSYADGRTLELGCGTGLNLAFYPRHVKELTAVDWSAQMLMQAMTK